jgi:hypothetical protein
VSGYSHLNDEKFGGGSCVSNRQGAECRLVLCKDDFLFVTIEGEKYTIRRNNDEYPYIWPSSKDGRGIK